MRINRRRKKSSFKLNEDIGSRVSLIIKINIMKNRQQIIGIITISLIIAVTLTASLIPSKTKEKPNVILILTDDQGFGDLGFNGNPLIKTPVLDKLAEESVRFNEFYVCPVCAPTRSALMTGRYTMRTGVHDTFKGGAIMATSEVTIAEVLKDAGYQTGMIGKWHLGDNYPFRPEDQGFDYTLRHLSGGMGQIGDWPNHLDGDRSYFDPVLWKNGKRIQTYGYCSDIFTDAAIQFIEREKDKHFFLYLSFNAPHVPLQVPDKYYEMYKNIDPSKGFEKDTRPFPNMSEKEKEDARRVYAMVTNIDDNLGRLFSKLRELRIEDNTLVIFLTDNGPQQYRYLAGMRGKKSSVYEGGVHVPSFWRCPSVFTGNRDITNPAAHFDVLPTLAELCGGKIPKDRKIDGKSLLPLLKNEKAAITNRSYCNYWKRGYPEKYRNVSIREGDYKLVGNCNETSDIKEFELYNLIQDPFEQNNIVEKNIQKASILRGSLDNWLNEMMTSPNIENSPRAIIGTKYENPTFLNHNDVIYVKNKEPFYDLGPEKEIENFNLTLWKVDFYETGNYKFIFHFRENITSDVQVILKIGDIKKNLKLDCPNANSINLGTIEITKGEKDIIPFVLTDENDSKKNLSPFYVEVRKER